MENIREKEAFLRNEYIPMLEQLDPATTPLWGKMNVQQMIEHMADYMRIGNGKRVVAVVTNEEALPKYRAFMESEKPFKENTGNPLMPDIPAAVKHSAVQHAIEELQAEVNHFFEVFNNDAEKKVTNPIFGELDYTQSIQLLHKHATHHLRQFGVAI
ncbi:MAG: DinB family protein [Bacteroidetes bacterium]|nr:DinB family protein [Bacteroidota bacterium]